VSSQGSPSTIAAFAYTHRTNPLKSQSRGSMELIPAETSLVVAGAWNAAILTPPWVLKHAFHKPPQDQHTVQVFLPAAAGLIFESPRFAFEGVTYTVRPDALVFAPNSSDSDSLFKVETAVANIVGVLSHTPVTGIGHNFEFRDMEPEPAHGAVFSQSRQDLADAMPEGWQATTAAVVSSFKNTNETVHVSIHRQWDGAVVSVKFNFHHPVTSVEQARAVLIGDGYKRMAESLALAKQLTNSLYGDEQ
jgi:hypothetical protein